MATKRQLILVGGGGTCSDALVLIDSINRVSPRYEVVGVLDDAFEPGSMRYGIAVLGGLGDNAKWPQVWFVDCLGSPNAHTRREKLLLDRGFDPQRFESIVHPSVFMAGDVTFGPGCIFFPNVVALSGVTVGAHVTVLSNSVLNHDVNIGDYAIVASGVNLSGRVSIGRAAYVGTGSCVREGMSVGAGALVGMGSAVTQSVADGVVVAGCPAKLIKKKP